MERAVLGGFPGDEKLTVNAPDATPIVDGVSDMFRIVATGTLAFPDATDNDFAINQVTIATGLTYPPVLVVMIEPGAASAIPVPQVIFDYAATGAVLILNDAHCEVVATNKTRITFRTWNNSGVSPNGGAVGRFYVLEQVGI